MIFVSIEGGRSRSACARAACMSMNEQAPCHGETAASSTFHGTKEPAAHVPRNIDDSRQCEMQARQFACIADCRNAWPRTPTGSARAGVVLIGQQPGDAADRSGRPFVARAGRLPHGDRETTYSEFVADLRKVRPRIDLS